MFQLSFFSNELATKIFLRNESVCFFALKSNIKKKSDSLRLKNSVKTLKHKHYGRWNYDGEGLLHAFF